MDGTDDTQRTAGEGGHRVSKRTTVRSGYSREASLVTEIVLETFRLNGRLTFVGDRMTKSLGLSTARWQAIGAVSLAHRPLTVPQIARSMGLQRQSVQRTINVLLDDGLVETVDNPDHQRARL